VQELLDAEIRDLNSSYILARKSGFMSLAFPVDTSSALTLTILCYGLRKLQGR